MQLKISRVLLISVMSVLVCTGCGHHKRPNYHRRPVLNGKLAQPLAQAQPTQERIQYNAASFDSIVVEGPVLTLLKQGPKQSVAEIGYPNSLAMVQQSTRDGVLYIRGTRGVGQQYHPVTVEIVTPTLQSLKIKNCANLMISGDLHISHLAIKDEYRCPINLRGQMFANNVRVEQDSYGSINIGWLQANKINVKSEDGAIKIAGRAKKLHMSLEGRTTVDVKHLRANDVSIDAKDSAYAEVIALDELHAHTVDRSNIFYYKTPAKLDITTRDGSNVLQLDHWH